MIPQVSFFQINRLYRQHGPAFVWHLWQQYGDLFYAHPPLLPRKYFVLDAADVYDLLVKPKPMLLNEAAKGHTATLGFAKPVQMWLHKVQRGET